MLMFVHVQWRREGGGAKEGCVTGGIVQRRHMDGRKYGILVAAATHTFAPGGEHPRATTVFAILCYPSTECSTTHGT